ncbi:MAG: DUF2510 domain-containing protein, partial [Acidimicrobiales bacterium]
MAAGWHKDPFRRSEYRYFDGAIWTDKVYSGDYGRDVVSVDHLHDDRVPEGVWRASFGSLALSIGGLVFSFGLSILFLVPLIVSHHHGNSLVRLIVSESGLWIGFYSTCVITSRKYGTGKIRADFRWRFRWQDLWIALVAAIVARCLSAIVLVPFVHEVQKAGNPDKSIYSITSLGAWGWFALVVST